MEDRFPKRSRPPHHPAFDQNNAPVIHFVTVCTKDRRPLLGSAEAHRAIVDAWKVADRSKVGRYVILPDHVHFFCAPVQVRADYLKPWVRYWKSLTTRSMASVAEGELWQRDFWDTQLRREESYDAKWEYVRCNPVRHGLVQYVTEWPHQGEMHVLKW
jgi:putative transposase